MSYLLFLDESGHDHKSCPYEVRGGIALHISRLWSFIQDMQALEVRCFGDSLHKFGLEIKGERLLKKRRFKNASQLPDFDESTRRKHALSFLNKGASNSGQSKAEFTAYSQACLCMAQSVFELLDKNDAKVFAVAIPRGVKKPQTGVPVDFLRKDQVFLFERFYYYLEKQKEHGLIVMDETDKGLDREFVSRMHAYFTKTKTGRYRTTWIVPTPVFVESDMAYPIQAADICIYCINWGFRLSQAGMNALARKEIQDQFMPWMQRLQFHGERVDGENRWPLHGILCVPDPYESRGI
jgi:hypothetical protein